MILSSVLLPHPFLPMMPSVSPRRTSRLTSSSTCSRSVGRRRKRSSTCSRTVSRRARGNVEGLGDVTNVKQDRRVRHRVLRGAWGVPPVDENPDTEHNGRLERETEMGEKRRNRAVHENLAREQQHGRRRPQVQVEVHPQRQNAHRIDDRRDEETGLRDHVPDLVQVPVSQEQHAVRRAEADHDREHARPGTRRTAGPRESRRSSGQRQDDDDDDREKGDRDDRVRRRGHDEDPRAGTATSSGGTLSRKARRAPSCWLRRRTRTGRAR